MVAQAEPNGVEGHVYRCQTVDPRSVLVHFVGIVDFDQIWKTKPNECTGRQGNVKLVVLRVVIHSRYFDLQVVEEFTTFFDLGRATPQESIGAAYVQVVDDYDQACEVLAQFFLVEVRFGGTVVVEHLQFGPIELTAVNVTVVVQKSRRRVLLGHEQVILVPRQRRYGLGAELEDLDSSTGQIRGYFDQFSIARSQNHVECNVVDRVTSYGGGDNHEKAQTFDEVFHS